MARICSTMIVIVCLLTSSAMAQAPKPGGHTVVLDVSIIEINRNQLGEMEGLAKEKARLDRFIADGKARPVASVQLRSQSGESASLRVGQRMPVQTQAQTVGQIQYENTSLSVDARPTLLDNGMIVVRLSIELSGVIKSVNPLAPTSVQRSFNDTVQIRPNEVTLLLGVAQHELLWSTQTDSQAGDQSRGSFVVLLNARLLD